jgi:quinol monooxygenase YgiN
MHYTSGDKLVMLSELTIKPEKRDEFLEYVLQNLEISRAAAGNIAFDILVDEMQPNRMRFYEVWESAEAQQAYMAWRVERGDLTTLLALLAEQPQFAALRSIEIGS